MSASEETVVADQQKEVDTSKDSEELSQCSNYDTPGKGSDADPEETADDDHLSDYAEGDGDGPNVQPLDSSDEERAPDDDDQQDLDSDQESVTVDDEREEGDGQESSPSKEKKLDDDEDRRNPQYIPKRGTFYEHDDRTADDMPETPSKESKIDSRDGKEVGKDSGRKVWKDKEDRWQHDRFQEGEQAPKSREELLQVYGYDIRNEEAPPKARRRRRYGRGPNKYTRSWEDEEAYSRPLGAFIVEKEGDNKAKPRKPKVLRQGGGAGGSYRNNSNSSVDGEGANGAPKPEFPALSSSEDNGVGNGEEKDAASQPSFSNKLSGSVSSKPVAGTFNANPKDVVAPFGSQQKHHRSGQHQSQSGQNQMQPRQDDDHKRGWRRESNDDMEGANNDRAGPRSRGGRPSQGRNRRDDDREGHRWSDHPQTNGQSRGRGSGPSSGRGFRRGGPTQSPSQGGRRQHQQQREHDEGNESDVAQHGYSEDVSRDMGNLSISANHSQSSPGGEYQRRPSNGTATGSNGIGDRRQSMPPRMQENSGSRPKRYSSMRPRNVPETSPAQPPPVSASYTPPAPHAYYRPGYGPGSVGGVAPLYQEANAMPAASPGHQPGPPVPNMPTTLASAIPSTIQCFPQASFIAPPPGPQPLPQAMPQPLPQAMPQAMPQPLPQALPQALPPARLLPPGGFIPPGASAPSFVAATSPQGHVPVQVPVQVPVPGHVQGHVQGQYQQLAFQPYQPIAMVSGVSQPQPAELYQPQGGITYYSTQNQIIPRAAPQPRVKAAIPILPPPERSSMAYMIDADHGDVHDAVLEDMSHSSTPPAEMTIVSNENTNVPS